MDPRRRSRRGTEPGNPVSTLPLRDPLKEPVLTLPFEEEKLRQREGCRGLFQPPFGKPQAVETEHTLPASLSFPLLQDWSLRVAEGPN